MRFAKVLIATVALARLEEIFSVATASPIEVDEKHPHSRVLRSSTAKSEQQDVAAKEDRQEDPAASIAQLHDAEIFLAAASSGMITHAKKDSISTTNVKRGGIKSNTDIPSTVIQKQQRNKATRSNKKLSSMLPFPSVIGGLSVSSSSSSSREVVMMERFLDLQELSTSFGLADNVLSMIDTTDLPMFQPLVAKLRELSGQASETSSAILSEIISSSSHQHRSSGNYADDDDNSSRRRRRLYNEKTYKDKRFRKSSSQNAQYYQHIQDALMNGDMDFIEKMKMQYETTNRVDHGRMLREEDSEKERQCQDLVDCAGKMSLYDIIISFREDDIDFEEGTFDDDNESPFDDGDLFVKQQKIKDAVNNAIALLAGSVAFSEGDACDKLLKQFHTVQETKDFSVWRGTPVAEVCLAEGAIAYVSISEISKNLGEDVGFAIAQSIFACAKRIYDNRPAQYLNESYVFEDPRIPTSVKDIKLRSDGTHGQPNTQDPDEFYDFTNLFGPELEVGGYEFDNALFLGIVIENLQGGCLLGAAEYYKRIFLSGREGLGLEERYPDIKIMCKEDALTDIIRGTFLFNCQLVVENPPAGIDPPVCFLPDGVWDDQDFPPNTLGRVPTTEACKEENGGCLFFSLSRINTVNIDTATELVFGKQTSVGEICGIAESSMPGNCCLDTPFSSTNAENWGTEYTCKDGCKKFAPYFSGVNEDACAVYGGKWCPNPQDCTDLKECIAKTITEAEKDMDRTLAYRNYLEGAPTIKVPTSTQECGDARAYFGFDPFFPNDDQICDDVKQLRGSRDFEVLNDFAKGGNGKKGEDLELMEPGQPEFTEAGAKRWRSNNFRLGQITETLASTFDGVSGVECPDDLSGATQTICAVAINVLQVVSLTARDLSRQAYDISANLYDETVGTSEIQDQTVVLDTGVIYENMKRIHARGNKILEVTNSINITGNKILEVTNSINITGNKILEDTKLIKELVTPPKYDPEAKNAGCDGIDQDFVNGSLTNMADNCEEDNYPPELVLLERLPVVNVDPADDIFLLKNYDDVFRLEKSFSRNEAIAYLNSATQVADDCSKPGLLTRNVEVVRLSCSDSEFKVTPIQEKCPGTFLSGTPINFILDVDEVAPVVSCGFTNIMVPEKSGKKDSGKKDKPIRWVDGKNLFLRAEGGNNWNPVDTGLFYEVEDDCPGEIDVRVSVKSNEYAVSVKDNEYKTDPSALLFRKYESGSVQQAKLFVASTSCDEQHPDICVQDPSTTRRLYEVEIVVTDKAGNSAKDVCTIIVVPKREFDDEFPPLSLPINLPDEIISSEQRFDAADLSLQNSVSGTVENT